MMSTERTREKHMAVIREEEDEEIARNWNWFSNITAIGLRISMAPTIWEWFVTI
jgi:hypothetical protein